MPTPLLPDDFEADDAPELTEEWAAGATLMVGDRIIRAGRPPLPPHARREPVTMRLSPHVLAHFRATGRGWQRRISDILEAHIATAK